MIPIGQPRFRYRTSQYVLDTLSPYEELLSIPERAIDPDELLRMVFDLANFGGGNFDLFP